MLSDYDLFVFEKQNPCSGDTGYIRFRLYMIIADLHVLSQDQIIC